jgi:hypothetical protein
MQYLTATEARQFAEPWLPAWTGNNPEHLGSFYSEDTFYLDPATPRKGRCSFCSLFGSPFERGVNSAFDSGSLPLRQNGLRMPDPEMIKDTAKIVMHATKIR